jgi:uridine kinase
MRERPFFVAVVGGTGSGKSTVVERIASAMPDGSVITLTHDSYYMPRPDLPAVEREKLNFDHPDALDNERLIDDLERLSRGETIQIPIYDFATHLRRDETRLVRPAPIVVVEGILLFVAPALRERFDLKLFVDTDADIRILRRMRRDIDQRGRSLEQIQAQYLDTVRPMHELFVEPSKRFADLIIPEGGHNDVALDLVLSKLRGVLR